MLWRYRFVPQRAGWELPGGIVEGNEDPAVTAAREIEEETGWRPESLEHVVTYQPMIGMVDSPHKILVGRGATLVGEPEEGEESGLSGSLSPRFRRCLSAASWQAQGLSSPCYMS